ncbi:metal-dependent hydrolase [Planctopirus hydrillae]|uniref:Hydrolase n=1 Tax=Planctopirus hydrillae TaxID=1841610 RepID=A0A1C3ESY1_9PLAN|nr:metal-dependent hydrolase [Planctopirus hydrillae]ODA36362.1 hypothetical protein A6X21_16285 [Planctopirus hydrillae]
MPFTPFHMGPGLLWKGLQPAGLSLMTFGLAQVLIDLEPLYVLKTGKDFLGVPGHLHGISHTILGATVIGVVAGAFGRPLTHLGLRLLGQSQFIPVRWGVIWWSAFFGTYSHLLLDAVMHRDVEPFVPISRWNPLVGLVDVGTLHRFCIITALAGMLLYVGRWMIRTALPRAKVGETRPIL